MLASNQNQAERCATLSFCVYALMRPCKILSSSNQVATIRRWRQLSSLSWARSKQSSAGSKGFTRATQRLNIS